MSSSIRMNLIMIRRSLVLGFMTGLRLRMLIMVVGKGVIFLGEGVDEEVEDLVIEITMDEEVTGEDMATEMTDLAETGTDLILEEVTTLTTLAETATTTAAEETDLATATLETVLIMTTEEEETEIITENEKTGTPEFQIIIMTTQMLTRLADESVLKRRIKEVGK